MRIALTGAHGVGKTTLTKLFAEESGFTAPTPTPMHNPVRGQAKSLQVCTDEEIITLTQRRYTERIVQEHSAENVISDGSVLHEWVYATTRLLHGAFPSNYVPRDLTPGQQKILDVLEAFTQEALAYAEDTYDEIFYLPVEFELPRADAPISDAFQRIASDRLYSLLASVKLPVRVLRGSPEERANQISAVLHYTPSEMLQSATP